VNRAGFGSAEVPTRHLVDEFRLPPIPLVSRRFGYETEQHRRTPVSRTANGRAESGPSAPLSAIQFLPRDDVRWSARRPILGGRLSKEVGTLAKRLWKRPACLLHQVQRVLTTNSEAQMVYGIPRGLSHTIRKSVYLGACSTARNSVSLWFAYRDRWPEGGRFTSGKARGVSRLSHHIYRGRYNDGQ